MCLQGRDQSGQLHRIDTSQTILPSGVFPRGSACGKSGIPSAWNSSPTSTGRSPASRRPSVIGCVRIASAIRSRADPSAAVKSSVTR